jgi:membrane protein implicated in regulation of membrane protease activity
MTWADFYLVCFVVGFVLSLFAFLGVHMHLPFHFHGGHGGGAGHGLGHGAAHGAAHGSGHAQSVGKAGGVSPFNFVTFTAFLAWFGGTGFLLTRYSSLWFWAGLATAVAIGLLGAFIIYVFMAKVLMSPDETLDPADFRMEGVLGYLSNPIREGGTGELIYSQAGTRRTCGARSDEGIAIEKGTEVIVTRYERGLAYVRTWDDMAGENNGDDKERS